jgi:Tol biopolymer transport system component
MNPNGSGIQRIFGGPMTDGPVFTEGISLYRNPHWTRQSPNGLYFASWAYDAGLPADKYQGEMRAMLWVGGMDGKWARILSPDCTEEFAWSPDSTRLAFSILSKDTNQGYFQAKNDHSTEIAISRLDGSNFDCVLEQRGTWLVEDWSIDGDRLLLSCRGDDPKLEQEKVQLFEFRLTDALVARRRAGFESVARGHEWTAKSASDFLQKVNCELDGLTVECARYSPDGKQLAILAADPKKLFAPNELGDDDLSRGRMLRLLGKLLVVDRASGKVNRIAEYPDGIRGPICWSSDGATILFSRYLPKDDDRERFSAEKEHGLSIWSVDRDGKNARFITTGWSPDCPHEAQIR